MSESFIGRGAAIETLDRAVDTGERIVVVTGPPGVGKSRLVAEWTGRRSNPVARADLGAASDLEDALRRVGRALEVQFGPTAAADEVVSRITRVLAGRNDSLLWLDDADALIGALGPVLTQFVDGAPNGVIVVTSRSSRIEAEHCSITLGPLDKSEAVALLVERARRVRSDFVLSDAQRPSVDTLIDRADALPLAIELIAPRLRLVSPARLAARLAEDSASMGGALRDAIEQSFLLLSPWELDALAQCTVFRDGFDLEAAEAVLDLTQYPSAPDVWTVLEGLVEQSLLRTESVHELPDEVRMRFFGAVRERAAEELDETRRAAARERHAAWFVEAAEVWDAGIESPDEVEHTARLIVELPNLEAAFGTASGATRARLGLVLHMAYQRRGPFGGQSELVSEVCALAETLDDDRLRARGGLAAARVHRWANALDESELALQGAISAAKRANDIETEAGCARNLAANRYRAGDMEGFQAELERAFEAATRSGRAVDEVNARNGLGYLYTKRGDTERARAELDRASRLAEETGIPGLIALTQSSLSSSMLDAERFEAAEHHASRAIAAYETLGYLRQWSLEHLVRAEARLWSDDLVGAHEDAAAALERALYLALDGPLQRALEIHGKVAFYEQEFGVARDTLETVCDEHDAGARTWAYLGAARAMMGHLAAAHAAFDRASEDPNEQDDEVRATLLGFVTIAKVKATLAHGGDADLSKLPLSASSSVESQRAAELLGSVARQVAPGRAAAGVRLEVAPDGRWFRLGGEEGVDLTRRRALRGVLAGLVDNRVTTPGAPMTLDGVLDAGWPGERMSPESGARRVYVTINRLRKLGLGELLLTTGDGYMLAPRVEVVHVS